MTPFQALLRSLLEQVKSYVQQDVDLRAIRVTGDELSQSAHVEIALRNDTWDAQQRAIEHMVEVQAMFLDEVSLDYAFVRADDWVSEDAGRNRTQFVYAS